MSGINYDLRKIKGFAFDVDGVLSPSVIPMAEDGNPVRMANIKDGYALQLAARLGYKLAIITGGNSPAIAGRFAALGFTDIFMKASDKIDIFNKWMNDRNLTPEETVYFGDDIPDLKCMRLAGLPCAPRDGAREARETALYVSRFDGGYGCVRDVVEQVLRANGQWLGDDRAFGW